MRYYIDCEFDGHNGPLLSIALVGEDMRSIHIRVQHDEPIQNEWVSGNVIPIINCHEARMSQYVPVDEVGPSIRHFLLGDDYPHIIADSPVDIFRFCKAISTGANGEWESCRYERMDFTVFNIDAYPCRLAGAVRHNAWWDALALKTKIDDEL